MGYVANLPTCGPLLILAPSRKCLGPPNGKGYVANPPTGGPLLTLSPALGRWGPFRRQGLYSQSALLCVTTDFVPPALWRWGPQTVGVIQPIGLLVGHC